MNRTGKPVPFRAALPELPPSFGVGADPSVELPPAVRVKLHHPNEEKVLDVPAHVRGAVDLCSQSTARPVPRCQAPGPVFEGSGAQPERPGASPGGRSRRRRRQWGTGGSLRPDRALILAPLSPHFMQPTTASERQEDQASEEAYQSILERQQGWRSH